MNHAVENRLEDTMPSTIKAAHSGKIINGIIQMNIIHA